MRAHPTQTCVISLERESQRLRPRARAHDERRTLARDVPPLVEGARRRAPRVAAPDAPELGPDPVPGFAPRRATFATCRAEIRAQEAQAIRARDTEVAPVQLRELRPRARAERTSPDACCSARSRPGPRRCRAACARRPRSARAARGASFRRRADSRAPRAGRARRRRDSPRSCAPAARAGAPRRPRPVARRRVRAARCGARPRARAALSTAGGSSASALRPRAR